MIGKYLSDENFGKHIELQRGNECVSNSGKLLSLAGKRPLTDPSSSSFSSEDPVYQAEEKVRMDLKMTCSFLCSARKQAAPYKFNPTKKDAPGRGLVFAL